MPYGFVYEFLFYLFGVTAVASAVIFVTRRNPVAAALWLVNTMFCIAALYIMMDAQFVGAIQVLVYAGAIMVVFLFVVMLAEVLVIARQKLPPELAWLPRGTSVTTPITEPLFRAYLLPFEITSVLLLVAIVGAVVLAKKRS